MDMGYAGMLNVYVIWNGKVLIASFIIHHDVLIIAITVVYANMDDVFVILGIMEIIVNIYSNVLMTVIIKAYVDMANVSVSRTILV